MGQSMGLAWATGLVWTWMSIAACAPDTYDEPALGTIAAGLPGCARTTDVIIWSASAESVAFAELSSAVNRLGDDLACTRFIMVIPRKKLGRGVPADDRELIVRAHVPVDKAKAYGAMVREELASSTGLAPANFLLAQEFHWTAWKRYLRADLPRAKLVAMAESLAAHGIVAADLPTKPDGGDLGDDPVGWRAVGAYFRRHMAAFDFDLWAVNELPAAVRTLKDRAPYQPGDNREIARALVGGLHQPAGLPPMRGIVFQSNAGQLASTVATIKRRTKAWLSDDGFWRDMEKHVAYYAIEAYASPLRVCDPAADGQTQRRRAGEYIWYLLDLAEAGPASPAARYLSTSLVPLLNNGWQQPKGFGLSKGYAVHDVDALNMQRFVRQQTAAVRARLGARPARAIGFAWAPNPELSVAHNLDPSASELDDVARVMFDAVAAGFPLAPTGHDAAAICEGNACKCYVPGAHGSDLWGDAFGSWLAVDTDPEEDDVTGEAALEDGEDFDTVPDAAAPPPPVTTTCNPPHTIDIGGRCVPSCGAAGGNTCDPGQCAGLNQLEAHDCATCCIYTPPPPPDPGSGSGGGCTPDTCPASAGYFEACGVIDDGCGGALSCGDVCGPGLNCCGVGGDVCKKELGQPCAGPGQCCSAQCQANTPGAAAVCCHGAGEWCDSDAKCCGALVCRQGACRAP